VRVELPPEALDELVEHVAARVLEQLPAAAPAPVSPYLSIDEAAAYLRAKRQRVYDLLSAGRLTRFKDGSRVLVSRAELDAHLGGVAHPLPTGPRGRMAARRAA
jgi:excisionase family DNA binding protein